MTLSLSIATIAWFSKNFTLWTYDYDTFQPKIGQCEAMHSKASFWLMHVLHDFEFCSTSSLGRNSKLCKICISQHEALECNVFSHSNPLWRSHKRPRTRLWVTRNTGPKSCRGGIDSKWNVPWCSAGIGSLPYLSLEALVYRGWHCKCPIMIFIHWPSVKSSHFTICFVQQK